mmetsp:Transcript_13619/g.21403  ORF Transcript_13619/g.21403 Transcript_13619/m.21403 type:complete len:170 (-) Transcript_13619:35-544(-)
MLPLVLSFLIYAAFGDANCMFKDSGGTSNTLDLSYFLKNNITISAENKAQGYTYSYSPCQGLYQCSSNEPMAMIMRQESAKPSTCEWLSKWDNGAMNPMYHYTDDETWTWMYSNASITNKCKQFGDADIVEVIWNCSSVTNHDYDIQWVGERSQCIYQVAINSKYACPS